MAIFEDDAVKRTQHEIGQDLTLLSVDELSARIEMLEEEIARLQAERGRKSEVKSAAEAFFRRE